MWYSAVYCCIQIVYTVSSFDGFDVSFFLEHEMLLELEISEVLANLATPGVTVCNSMRLILMSSNPGGQPNKLLLH